MVLGRGVKKMWCVPHLDDTYLKRMKNVLELYEKPYDSKEPVICLDENPIVLHKNVRASVRLRNGSLRRDFEYKDKKPPMFFAVLSHLRAGTS